MKFMQALILATAILLAPSALFKSAHAEATQNTTNGGESVIAKSVGSCWQEWLDKNGLVEGFNEATDKIPMRFISHGMATINTNPSEGEKWVDDRAAQFSSAELQARDNLAKFISTYVSSGRSREIYKGGGDNIPPATAKVASAMSIADKALTLTTKALDEEIKKYDPNWDGTGRSEEERKQEILKAQTEVKENSDLFSRVMAAGAMTPVQCEGPNNDKKYAVYVGLIWSQKLAAISAAITDPSFDLPVEKPGIPLKERLAQFDKDDPNWMAATLGVRVFTDENGHRVVVGFGSSPASFDEGIDEDAARDQAIVAIQRFVAENIVAHGKQDGIFAARSTNNGTNTYDAKTYTNSVIAEAPRQKIVGMSAVKTWRGKHPYSGALMSVVAVKWTQDGAKSAGVMNNAMDASQKPKSSGAGATGSGSNVNGNASGAAVTKGASSSSDDF